MLRFSQPNNVFRQLIPNYYATSVQNINFAALRQQGIRCVALDIDNTLVPHGGVEVNQDTIQFFREQRDTGNIEILAIATNRSQKNLAGIGEAIHADVTFHARGILRRKPFQRYFSELLQQMNCTPGETVMVGDKIIQDIGGGNNASLTTILVDPLSPAMWFEKLLFKLVHTKAEPTETIQPSGR